MLFFEFMLTKLFKISKENQTFKQLNTQIRHKQLLKCLFTIFYE